MAVLDSPMVVPVGDDRLRITEPVSILPSNELVKVGDGAAPPTSSKQHTSTIVAGFICIINCGERVFMHKLHIIKAVCAC